MRIDDGKNYFLSCKRPGTPSDYSHVSTSMRMKLIPPLATPGQLSFHYFCGGSLSPSSLDSQTFCRRRDCWPVWSQLDSLWKVRSQNKIKVSQVQSCPSVIPVTASVFWLVIIILTVTGPHSGAWRTPRSRQGRAGPTSTGDMSILKFLPASSPDRSELGIRRKLYSSGILDTSSLW